MIDLAERNIAAAPIPDGGALLNIKPLLPVHWPVRVSFAGWPARMDRIGPFGVVLKAVVLPTFTGTLELHAAKEGSATPAIVIGGTLGRSAHFLAFTGTIAVDLCGILLEAAFAMGDSLGNPVLPSAMTLPRGFDAGTRRKFDALYAISGDVARTTLRVIAGALAVSAGR